MFVYFILQQSRFKEITHLNRPAFLKSSIIARIVVFGGKSNVYSLSELRVVWTKGYLDYIEELC